MVALVHKSMNMGCGFNTETLGLNMSQQWAWDAALKTVKVKVGLTSTFSSNLQKLMGAG